MIARLMATGVALTLIASCQPGKSTTSSTTPVSVKLGTGALPPTLEETGIFADISQLSPSPGMLQYDVQVPLWSDGAQKTRLVFTPEGKSIAFNGTKLEFPTGSVFVKHFKSESDPSVNIETRVIVLNEDGGWVYGTYLWHEDGTTELLENSRMVKAGGKDYYVPAAAECVTCHRSNAEVLGFSPAQLNHGSQIQMLADSKILGPNVQDLLASKPLNDINDTSLSADVRARTYMEVNCSTCHNPNGPMGAKLMDMRLEAADTRLLSLEKIIPGKPDDSILFQKISGDTSRMPPVSLRPDPIALEIFRAYIQNMEELPTPGADQPDDVPDTNQPPVTEDPAGEQDPQQS